MTILSKIETLIEYAKFGMFLCKYQNNKTGELFFPRAITTYGRGNNSDWQKMATSITGHLKMITGPSFLSTNTVTEVVDLPDLISLAAWGVFQAAGALKICKLPRVRKCDNPVWRNAVALEYLELGAVTHFATATLEGCSALKEFYVKEGTTSSLYLYHCPELTQESLHSVIECYADMTGVPAPTFYVGEENLAKIDTEHIIMLEKKNIIYQ